ncbi:bifunctional hydroxymethylpyrimidine kinase/phosphomethylpyrimidine kinase [Paenibacillus protaetiae]|uniref:pyridoxal kinase n=1 Tax=Paenibacillus protaetiae TaxID=2509456 RepID=A0A4P6ES51_9BACL|nr:bifunctional hydroxymethylpyrimidine kinase/phosphomethylpyrimidine kinase [Paenibacillus protaetiae]QAY65752.1 bifunctional hydroxymethylpyrimidine kinase/phosphomethylpyrimidine kinase [Paenibacillus protaetiae]
MTIPKTLTIAGSDTSGGAGIQADLKTFQELGVYGMTVLTTIVAMEPNTWDHLVFPIDLNIVETQLSTVLDGIGFDAMKTGMLGSVDIIELVASRLKKANLSRIVIDPVMVCKGTDEVLQPENTDAMLDVLIPGADLVTPNLFEASQLAKTGPIRSREMMQQAAAVIHEHGAKHVLIKDRGVIEEGKAIDLLYDGKNFVWNEAPVVKTTFTHGAGCTTSAAITAGLAKGLSMHEAVQEGKAFITKAIAGGFPLNQFVGPTLHAAHRLEGAKR